MDIHRPAELDGLEMLECDLIISDHTENLEKAVNARYQFKKISYLA